MKNINMHDEEMRKLYKDVVCIPSAESKLQLLIKEKSDLHKKVDDLQSKLKCEHADVENLSKRSIANIFYQITGKMEEKLDKEKADVCEMALQYKLAVENLENISEEVSKYKTQLNILKDSEARYKVLFEVKSDAIEKSGLKDGFRLTEIENQQIKAIQDIYEIEQAIHEGECSLDMINAVLERLNSASGWGVFDLVLNGGLLSAMVKHQRMDEAEECMKSLQKQLARFKTELADVSIASEFSVGMDGGWMFADIFLDGLLVDYLVLRKINEAIDKVKNLKNEIACVLEKLKQLKDDNKAKIESIKAEKIKIIESYMN